MAEAVAWVAVDWGTSNVRVWGIGPDGAVRFSASSDRGMGKISSADYPAVLNGLLAPYGAVGRDALICGMAGARQGWIEAPYIETPAALTRLIEGAVAPPGVPARILPGVCQRRGSEDVMRGEETQLLGLLTLRPGYAGPVVMPGTHSKWVALEDGHIERFATAMTGELYDVLGTHSVLRHSLAGERDGAATEDGIAAGLAAGLEHPARLTGLLFRTRAASLLSGRGADWCSGYLSGLLVGAEIGGHRDWLGSGPVPLIGSARLCRLYAAGFARIGVASEIIDATDAVLAGLKAARQQGTN
ncbi:MAG TPA: 2-dehydro-3-deoxygalactonokinase [Alphaproteobacteria bacterium]|nr:2-dehydro-3-deoxygalactonokinase [Alphaproteobacteria bacterium]